METESSSLRPKQGDANGSETATFFNQKSVLITGGAGFLGSVLLQTLLQFCPGIKNVYILLREKKNVPPNKRTEIILQKGIFQQLHRENPDVFQKVKTVGGDVTSSDLGLCENDRDEILQNVSIVFHCAALLHFTKPLRTMLIQNVLGTQNVIDLCKKMKNLEALVYTSTAVCTCTQNEDVLEEIIYKTQVPASRFIKELKSYAGDDVLADLQNKCSPKWPNNYLFTKALAENLLDEYTSEIPIAIVRPTIIVSTWNGPLPGYVESGFSFTDLSIAAGKGFIKVTPLGGKKIADLIPVDVVANTLICVARKVQKVKSKPPLVVHCSTAKLNPLSYSTLIGISVQMARDHPLPNSFQTPSVMYRSHRATYWLSSMLNHYAPALVIDFYLTLLNKKPILTPLYKFFDKSLKILECGINFPFTSFSCKNFQELIEEQSKTDSEVFPLDVRKIDHKEFIQSLRSGAPFYNWETDKRGKEARIALMKRRAMITNTIKYAAIVFFSVLVYYLLKTLVDILSAAYTLLH